MFAYLEHSTVMARGSSDPESIDQIAYRLKITRAALDKTQAVMDQLMSAATGGQTWNNYERGIRRISVDNALALCRTCGLTLPWIYQGNITSLPADLAGKIQIQMALEAKKDRDS